MQGFFEFCYLRARPFEHTIPPHNGHLSAGQPPERAIFSGLPLRPVPVTAAQLSPIRSAITCLAISRVEGAKARSKLRRVTGARSLIKRMTRRRMTSLFGMDVSYLRA